MSAMTGYAKHRSPLTWFRAPASETRTQLLRSTMDLRVLVPLNGPMPRQSLHRQSLLTRPTSHRVCLHTDANLLHPLGPLTTFTTTANILIPLPCNCLILYAFIG